ncbi:hypothetical protein AB1Y20_001159 [Prymnesium parvum]|uniref:MYND-type domain-containing protein n=1 Tax=Prymnesium parvum TaxID=97485 RepID=A0AB34KCJ5_PRYPA
MAGCYHCQATDLPLKACVNCRCVHYCGTACQRADWPAHKPECAQLVEAILGGERETAMPPHLERRQAYLRADALELFRIARQESCGALRALSCLATALRCLRAAWVPLDPLPTAERDELAAAAALSTVEYARAHAAVHLRTAPRRCEAAAARCARRVDALREFASAAGRALAADVWEWCALQLHRLHARVRLQLGEAGAAREQLLRALAISSRRPAGGVRLPRALELWAPRQEALDAAHGSFADLAELARLEAREGGAPAKAGSFYEQAVRAGAGNASCALRREVAMLTHHRLHRTRLEVAAILQANPEIMEAHTRSEVRDEHWDQLVELQVECQRAERQCAASWQELIGQAVAENDAKRWSCAAAPFARFLKLEGKERDAQLLASKVAKLHACGGRCRDVMLAGTVAVAEGRSVELDEGLDAEDECALFDEDVWQSIRSTAILTAELTA